MSTKSGAQTLESMSQAVWYNQWTLKKFAAYLKGDILEAGCGIGNFTDSLTNYGNVWAIDINDEGIEETKGLVKGKAKVGFGDIEKGKYFFSGKKFNTIICLNVLEHIKEDERALENMYNLLKEGGRLILLVPAYDFLFGEIDKSIGHFRRYEKKKLKKLIKDIGFSIVKLKTLNMLGSVGWWISSKLLRRSIVEEGKIRFFNLIAPLFLPLESIIEPPFGTSILVIAQK